MKNDGDQNPREAQSAPGSPMDPRLVDTVEMDVLMITSATEGTKIPVVETVECGGGQAAWLTMKSPFRENANEDSLGIVQICDQRGLLVVADGLGGHRAGRQASESVVKSIRKAVLGLKSTTLPRQIVISKGLRIPLGGTEKVDLDAKVRMTILDRIESVNRKLLRNGAGSATTLALVEISGHRARTYHVGDSPILVVSQRGRIKHETVSHSPVGYAQEAGILSEREAILHEKRHIVSNVVGTQEMSIEIGRWVKLALRDTVLLASDGLFDNLFVKEIVEGIRKGPLTEGIRQLAELAVERMTTPDSRHPSKPDDLTILAFRRS